MFYLPGRQLAKLTNPSPAVNFQNWEKQRAPNFANLTQFPCFRFPLGPSLSRKRENAVFSKESERPVFRKKKEGGKKFEVGVYVLVKST